MKKVEFYPVLYDRRTHCVYAHINKKNGKIYFGITRTRPTNRWGAGSGYYKCSKFYPAIKRYGWDGFYHIVILRNLSKEEALYLEKSYIKLYNTRDRRYGYNTDQGGQDAEVSKLVKRRLIQERKIRPVICLETGERYESVEELEALDGQNHSYLRDACKSKGSRVHNGKHYLYIEDYIKLDLNQIQDIIDGKFQNHKEVVCMETGEVFWDATKAGRILSFGKNSVANRCNHFRDRGRDNFCGGFHWAYKEDYEKLTSEDIERIINLDNFRVVCIETGEIYDNPIEAGKATKADGGVIRSCCRGKFKHAAGLHWMYERDFKKATREDIEKLFNKPRKKMESIKIKKVVCLETKEVFDSITEAAQAKDANDANISKSCKCKGEGTFISGGYHWMFKEDYDKATEEEIRGRLKKRKITSKRALPVYCMETGIHYQSATQYKGKYCGNIVECCRRNRKDFKENKKTHFMSQGFHWFFYNDLHLLEGYRNEDLFKVVTNFSTTKEVICLETQKVYKSTKEVAASLGCSHDTIRKACTREDKIALGFHWAYYKDYLKFSPEEINRILNMQKYIKKASTPYSWSKKYKIFTKPIINATRNKRYESSLEASVDTGFNRNSITSACTKSHMLNNEFWFYEEDYNKLGESKVKEIILEEERKRDYRVICLETKEVFNGAADAQRKYPETNSGSITSCCRGNDPNRITAADKHWMYYHEYLKLTPEEIEEKLNIKRGQKASKAVIKLETLEVFPSVEAASAATGLSSKTIRYSCTGYRHTYSKNGHWMFKKDYDKATPEEIHNKLCHSPKVKSWCRKGVRCVETGEIFESISDAIVAVGSKASTSAISKCCKGLKDSYKGYHWEYVEG